MTLQHKRKVWVTERASKSLVGGEKFAFTTRYPSAPLDVVFVMERESVEAKRKNVAQNKVGESSTPAVNSGSDNKSQQRQWRAWSHIKESFLFTFFHRLRVFLSVFFATSLKGTKGGQEQESTPTLDSSLCEE